VKLCHGRGLRRSDEALGNTHRWIRGENARCKIPGSDNGTLCRRLRAADGWPYSLAFPVFPVVREGREFGQDG
jgi:hypothetical protein